MRRADNRAMWVTSVSELLSATEPPLRFGNNSVSASESLSGERLLAIIFATPSPGLILPKTIRS